MPGQGMQLRSSAHLALTPRLQQSVRLLQLSSIDFTQELDEALVSNPFLENDEPSREESPRESSFEVAAGLANWRGGGDSREENEPDFTEMSCAAPTLRDHLREQLLFVRCSARQYVLAELVVEALDEDGYLRHDVAELVALSGVEPAPTESEMDAAIAIVQALEPAGVAARDLGECLALQLAALPEGTPGRDLAVRIVGSHLNALAGRQYAKLQAALGCSEAELRHAHALIRSTSPRPGSRHGAPDTRYIIPDVIVTKVRDRWQASINPAVLPRIRLNQTYAQLFRQARSGLGTGPLTQQLQEARWLVRHAEQRFVTIQRVADSIVARQKNFFAYGEIALKPLGIRDVAQELGLHESTVSRATGNKYMATPRGIFLFRHFFSRELATESGGRCSAAAIRALLREMIAEEVPGAPCSDARLTQMLSEQGIRVARRTVTKYRCAIRIEAVEMRRMAHR